MTAPPLMTKATGPGARPASADATVTLDVVIEVPRGSFLKRGSTGRLDFVSPFPCPFNYGSVPTYLGLEGDLLDAVVLGPRLRRGTRVSAPARAAIRFEDRGLYDYKLICARAKMTRGQRTQVLLFFRFYALCKRLLNGFRGHGGRTACHGWCSATEAIEQASPREEGPWPEPGIPF
jgi:inorganic pyrophosphatase